MLWCVAVVLTPIAAAQGVPGPMGTQERYRVAAQRLENPPDRFEFARIARDVDALLAEQPDWPAARVLHLRALVRAGDRAAARLELQRITALRAALSAEEKLRVDIAAANLAGAPTREIEAMERLAQRRPVDRWLRYDIARAHGELEDYPAVVRSARRALEMSSPGANWEGSWIHYLHSKALFRAGDPRAAIAAAERGRPEKTTWRSTLYRMALGQFAAADVAGGQRSLDEYVRYAREEGRTTEALIQLNVGVFYHELGDLPAAEKYLRDGLALDPSSTYGLWALGYVLIEKPGALAEGTALIDRGLSASPADRNLLEAKGWALYRAGQPRDALAALGRARQAADGWDQRLENHLAEVTVALVDPRRPPAPRTPWL